MRDDILIKKIILWEEAKAKLHIIAELQSLLDVESAEASRKVIKEFIEKFERL